MLDIISILRKELKLRGIPAQCIASLSGISSGRLSSYLNGNVSCPGDDATKLIRTWQQVKRLLEFSTPLPLSFKNAGAIAECIRKMEDGTLKIIVYEDDEAPESASEVEAHQ